MAMKVTAAPEHNAYIGLCRDDFKFFLTEAFKILQPGRDFIDNWHIDAIVHCLRQSMTGELRRLILNMPPRQLKSLIVSVILPAFMLGNDPAIKIATVCYGDELGRALS